MAVGYQQKNALLLCLLLIKTNRQNQMLFEFLIMPADFKIISAGVTEGGPAFSKWSRLHCRRLYYPIRSTLSRLYSPRLPIPPF